jgi:hypothetical protein
MRVRQDKRLPLSRHLRAEIRATAKCTTDLAGKVMQNHYRRERRMQQEGQKKRAAKRGMQVSGVDREANGGV